MRGGVAVAAGDPPAKPHGRRSLEGDLDMKIRIVATLVIMCAVFGFCTVLLCFGNNVQTAVMWSGIAGGVSAHVAAQLLAGTSQNKKRR
jgi:hypothetical protein